MGTRDPGFCSFLPTEPKSRHHHSFSLTFSALTLTSSYYVMIFTSYETKENQTMFLSLGMIFFLYLAGKFIFIPWSPAHLSPLPEAALGQPRKNSAGALRADAAVDARVGSCRGLGMSLCPPSQDWNHGRARIAPPVGPSLLPSTVSGREERLTNCYWRAGFCCSLAGVTTNRFPVLSGTPSFRVGIRANAWFCT